MFLLYPYILAHFLKTRLADGNSEVVILPLKFPGPPEVLIDPERGFAFDELCDLRDGLFGAERYKCVNMFEISADRVEVDALLFRICSYVVEELSTEISSEHRLSVLCGPNEMNPHSDIWHVNTPHSLSGLKPTFVDCFVVRELKLAAICAKGAEAGKMFPIAVLPLPRQAM